MPKTWEGIDGWFDFAWLYSRVAEGATDESVLVEVGVWKGASITFLASALQRRGKRPKLLAAVDTWAGSPCEEHMLRQVEAAGGPTGLYQEFCSNLEACGVDELVIPYRMSSLEAAASFPDESIDFCMIDAAHDYDSVLADLRAWVRKMKPAGLLAGHDITHPGVRQAVTEYLGEDGFAVERGCWLKNCR